MVGSSLSEQNCKIVKVIKLKKTIRVNNRNVNFPKTLKEVFFFTFKIKKLCVYFEA